MEKPHQMNININQLKGLLTASFMMLISFTSLAGVSPFTPSQSTSSQVSGQLTLNANEHNPLTTGMFISPNKHAVLRISGELGSNLILKINDKLFFSGEVSPKVNNAFDISSVTEKGKNKLVMQVTKGKAVVSIDYPILVDHRQISDGINNTALTHIDNVVNAFLGIEDDDLYTGASLLIASQASIIYHKSFGYAEQLALTKNNAVTSSANLRLMTNNTIFDIASMTKVISTTAAVMHLVDTGKLSLDQTLGEILPEFAHTDKANITIQQLLTHRSGLWQWQPTWLYGDNKKDIITNYLVGLPLRYQIEQRRAYSDIGFILLGAIVESVSNESLQSYVSNHIHRPLGMNNTTYLPNSNLKNRIAATSHGNPFEQSMVRTGKPYEIIQNPIVKNTQYREYTLIGEVNDGNAWYGFNGVSGHAGLFSTPLDIAKFAQALLNNGGYSNVRLISKNTLNRFLSTPYDSEQALGFRKKIDNTGKISYGHPGFTGTNFLFQPDSGLIVIMLTNRQHKGLNNKTGRYTSISSVWDEVVKYASEAVNSNENKN